MAATLKSFAESLPGFVALEGGDASITDITHDSRSVKPASMFVAVSGVSFDGHDFVHDAVEGGASAILVERRMDVTVPQLIVTDTRAAMAFAARGVFEHPDQGLSIFGITGTNGKTTVAHLCESGWRAAGRSSGIIGTLGAHIDGKAVHLDRTTPESSDLQRLLGDMRTAGVRSVAMEVSSHSLELRRVDAISFSAVAFTNLSQDHLDFHGDMGAYFDAKRRLFQLSRSNVAVINIDDAAGARLADEVDLEVVTVGFGDTATVQAIGMSQTSSGSVFTLRTPEGDVSVVLPLVGRFNIANALVAAGLLRYDSVSLRSIAEGFESLGVIAGRMEIIDHDGPFTVLVDYAHTPDAVGTVLETVRESTVGQVIAVVGAAGDRDMQKRAPMGAAASKFADVTVVTTDNPRSEDPASIAADVFKGAQQSGPGDVVLVLERRDAISHAVSQAKSDDVVVILGKGHEQGQEVQDVVHPFDDRMVAREALRDLGWATP